MKFATRLTLSALLITSPWSFAESKSGYHKSAIPDPIVAYVFLGRDLSWYPSCDDPEAATKICSVPMGADSAMVTYRPDFPKWIKMAPSVVTKDGKIVSVVVETKGYDFQDEIFQMLTTQYGKPSSVTRTVVQNRMGAAFKKIYAGWKLPWGTVSFQGFADRLDVGVIGGTLNESAIPALTAAYAAKDSIRTQDQPKQSP